MTLDFLIEYGKYVLMLLGIIFAVTIAGRLIDFFTYLPPRNQFSEYVDPPEDPPIF